MFSVLSLFKKTKPIPTEPINKINSLGNTLLGHLDKIRSLNSSRFFENIIVDDKDKSEQQVSCYVGNFRLIYGFYSSLATIDWAIWNDADHYYNAIAFFQRVDDDSDWHVVSQFLDEELIEKHSHVERLLHAMETYEDFMYRRKTELVAPLTNPSKKAS